MRPKSISTHTEPDDEPQYDGPSKSQRKRESHALQDIGAQLVELSANQLKRIDMPDNLRLAIEETQRTRSREGCFKAFRLNHWIGATVFAGVVFDLSRL